MTKIAEILLLPELPEPIKDAVNDQKLAVFIGAGVSRIIGCDGWNTLAKKLVEKCAEESYIKPITSDILLTQSDNIKLISICHNIFCKKSDESSFMETMQKSLKYDEIDTLVQDNDRFQIYKDLKNIGNTFITTNADRFIDNLLDISNITFKTTDLKKNNIGNSKLYKIHGCLSDPGTLVFTKNKYMSTYADTEFTEFIGQFFSKYTVLFVGYGLNEFELLSKILPTAQKEKLRHCFLNPYYQHEQEVCDLESEYLSNLGIKLIPYSKDKKGYKQLINVISGWRGTILRDTLHIQNSFVDIDRALEKPISDIATTIQNMKNDEAQAHYFFSKAPNYQKLYLWLEPLFAAGFLSLNEDNKFHWDILEFLEKVSIQNKEDEKSEVTAQLLSIVDKTIKKATDDHIIWYMAKVLFNLPIKNITLEHIDFINSYVKKCEHRGILNHDITKMVMPVLIKNKMQKHMLKLLPLIFGYELKKDVLSHAEPISIIEEYNLQELLRKHSKKMIELIGLDGLKIVVGLITDITTQEESTFNSIWLTVIRTKTEDEIKQNKHSDRYDNQLIFFVRDLFESLSSTEIEPCIKDFLLKQRHPIFIRLALHVINSKYSELKDIFWQWMDTDIQYEREELELWTLLKERSEYFTNDEFDKIVGWIKTFNCREQRADLSDKDIKLCNAYRKKEYLLCLKDNNGEAQELYQKYHLMNGAEIEHPGFSYWSSGVYNVPRYSHPDKKKLCQDPINTIQNFKPSEIERQDFYTDEDLKRGLANDLSTCIKNDPVTFANKIDDFKNLEYVYKGKVIQGFVNAWNDKQKFDWEKVFGFIDNELSSDFFTSDEINKQHFVSEVANLIEHGTQKDDNAFDKKLLPNAKNILFKLLDNKYNEDGNAIHPNLVGHVLNSTNGKVLHALINYTLRCGRLNSSQPVKWEKEVQDFFTDQLENNDIYSQSVFTILGSYVHQLQFLDNQWLNNNFNKIFPLKNELLWKCSVTAYFFHLNTVHKEIYMLFKDGEHINKILLTDFKTDRTKSKLISFICVAYINDIDNDTIFDIISEDKGNILEIVRSMLQIYQNETSEDKKDKIKTIWNEIYDTYKDDNSSGTKKIFGKLCDWFVFLDEILDKDIELLKYTVEHAQGGYQDRHLIKEMARLSVGYAQRIGEIYIHMLGKDIYPTYEKGDIKQILDNLDNNLDNKGLIIKNCYRQEGIYNIL